MPHDSEGGEDFKTEDDVLPLWFSNAEVIRRTTTRPGRVHSTPTESATVRNSSDEAPDLEKPEADSATGPKLPPNTKLLPARQPPKASVYGMS